MNPLLLRALEHVHGHLGWLAALSLLHPAVSLRRTSRRALLSAWFGTALVSATGLLSALIYPAYRSGIKPHLFATVPAIGLAFERKEHLGIGAIALAWAGLGLHWAASQGTGPRPSARLAHLAYVGAAAMALLSAALGTLVAVERSF
ncbi:MAG TPA: hypothetical protein VH877_09970 [Polyangia bacterium]|jgi:hypothetical protein|nr:hypothetical protein [Polyangia bacterium]